VATKPTVILDPYLLVSLYNTIPEGALSTCDNAQFALCDHLPPDEFHPAEFDRIRRVVTSEDVQLLPVDALEVADLLHMRDVLVLHQIASIAAARSRRYLLASNCGIFRRMARTALGDDFVLCGLDLCQRFSLN